MPIAVPVTITAAEAAAYAALAHDAYDVSHRPDIRVGPTEIHVRVLPNGRLGLVWCGSTDAADWRANLRFARRWSKELGCWVHGGYLADHRATVDAVWQALAQCGWPEWEVIGHSRGAGQGLLMAAALAMRGHPPARIVTFGAPRVGFGGLEARLAGIPHVRVVCGADGVPHVPPSLAGWRHSAPAIAVGRAHDPLHDHLLETGYMPALASLPPETILTAAKPWYQSKGVVGGLAAVGASALAFVGVDPALVAPLAQVFGLDLPAADPVMVQAMAALAGGGGVLSILGRVTAKAAIGTAPAAPSARGAGSSGVLPMLMLGAVILAATAPLSACVTSTEATAAIGAGGVGVGAALDTAEAAVGAAREIGEEVVDRAYRKKVESICRQTIRAHMVAIGNGTIPAEALTVLCADVKTFVNTLHGAAR